MYRNARLTGLVERGHWPGEEHGLVDRGGAALGRPCPEEFEKALAAGA